MYSIIVSKCESNYVEKTSIARSPVFDAMLKHNMKEREQNKITIQDVDHKVLEEMLRFIYTGKAPQLGNMADALLAVAEKVGDKLGSNSKVFNFFFEFARLV